jgi:hypothetical protein
MLAVLSEAIPFLRDSPDLTEGTRRGRVALDAEMTALRELIARVDGGSPG